MFGASSRGYLWKTGHLGLLYSIFRVIDREDDKPLDFQGPYFQTNPYCLPWLKKRAYTHSWDAWPNTNSGCHTLAGPCQLWLSLAKVGAKMSSFPPVCFPISSNARATCVSSPWQSPTDLTGFLREYHHSHIVTSFFPKKVRCIIQRSVPASKSQGPDCDRRGWALLGLQLGSPARQCSPVQSSTDCARGAHDGSINGLIYEKI